MRKFKFRAWDDRDKKWLFGYEYPNLGGFSMFGEVILMGAYAGTLDTFLFERNGYKNTDIKLMQYTGLNDEDGKEIYEGDICSYKSYNYNPQGLGQVFYDEKDMCFKFRSLERNVYGDKSFGYDENSRAGFHTIKVLGNIYENKELFPVHKISDEELRDQCAKYYKRGKYKK